MKKYLLFALCVLAASGMLFAQKKTTDRQTNLIDSLTNVVAQVKKENLALKEKMSLFTQEEMDKKIREASDIVKKTWDIDIIHTNTSVRSLLHNNEPLQSRENLSEKLSTAVFRVPMNEMGTKKEAIEAANFLQKCLRNKEIYEQTMGAFRQESIIDKKPITNTIPFSKIK